MKTTTKKLSDTKVELTVTLDEKDIKTAEEKAITRLASELKLKGFRKGKVPMDIAKKHIPEQDINSIALDIAVRTSIPEAFREAKESPLVIPKVEVTKFVPHESAEYTATADILPDVELGKYKGLKVKKTEIKVTEKDVNDVVENIQTSYAEKKVAKKSAELGDEVVIDFEGTKDGEKFQGGSAKDFKLTLGSGQFIPGFEDGVVGHGSGDRFDLKLTFPKDYHAKELAGKKVNFNILVKQVNELVKPDLDDEFAKKCGPFKTLDELKEDIKKNLENQNKFRIEEKYKDDLVGEFVKGCTVSAPDIMIEDQIKMIKADISRNAEAQGFSFEDYLKRAGQTEEEWEKEARKVAETRVKASLCLQILARDEKIAVDDTEVDDKISELRAVYGKSKEALANLKKPTVRQDIKNRMTIEKVIDFLVKNNQ